MYVYTKKKPMAMQKVGQDKEWPTSNNNYKLVNLLRYSLEGHGGGDELGIWSHLEKITSWDRLRGTPSFPLG